MPLTIGLMRFMHENFRLGTGRSTRSFLSHGDSGTDRKTIKRKGKQSTLDAEGATTTEARKAMKFFHRESFEKASWVY